MGRTVHLPENAIENGADIDGTLDAPDATHFVLKSEHDRSGDRRFTVTVHDTRPMSWSFQENICPVEWYFFTYTVMMSLG